MPKYICKRCLKEFSQKSHYTNHLNRKNPCQDNRSKIQKIVEKIVNEQKKETSCVENPQHTFIEVCAGAGGLSKGFIDNGFIPLLLNDNNKYCVQTLKDNHPGINVMQSDMVDIDLNDYKNVDVLIGGVPCQSFSQAGKRKGINDKRGKLILFFIKMINIIEPKIFLVENVKGLKTHNKGETLKFIINEMNKLNKYEIKYEILFLNH